MISTQYVTSKFGDIHNLANLQKIGRAQGPISLIRIGNYLLSASPGYINLYNFIERKGLETLELIQEMDFDVSMSYVKDDKMVVAKDNDVYQISLNAIENQFNVN